MRKISSAICHGGSPQRQDSARTLTDDMGQVVRVGRMIRMHHCSCDRRCPKFMYVGGPFLAVARFRAPLTRPTILGETYVQCSSERGSCLSCASDIWQWALSPLGSNVPQQQACECDAGHRFSVGSVGHGEHDRKARRQGGETEL